MGKCNPSSWFISHKAGRLGSSSSPAVLGMLAGNLLGWKESRIKAEPAHHHPVRASISCPKVFLFLLETHLSCMP